MHILSVLENIFTLNFTLKFLKPNFFFGYVENHIFFWEPIFFFDSKYFKKNKYQTSVTFEGGVGGGFISVNRTEPPFHSRQEV